MNSNPKLPYLGQWHLASEPRFAETVLFVHHFGGSTKTLRRHIEFINGLGFNAVSFQLDFNELSFPMRLPLSAKSDFGIFSIWRDQIEVMLNAVPGNKIVFAFSNPSFSTISAIALRHAADVRACICDGGPAYNIIRSWWNLIGQKYRSKNAFFKAAMLPLGFIFIGPNFKAKVANALSTLPNGFPILSIRGWQDSLVPYEEIEAFFEGHPNIDLKVLSLPEGKHLDGLKNQSKEYIPVVTEFLNKHGRPI
jgi:pimeloyl-ACP methyl ester carboxylesterase